MLYGEGHKAFIKLQEEIMKQSDDQSLFAWVDQTAPPHSYHGLLAKCPAVFVDTGDVVPYRDWVTRAPSSVSNRGLCIDLHLRLHLSKKDMYLAALNCAAPQYYEGFCASV